jgi:GR25 family glycosyltransferase involved in LPS biosynthesis
MNQHFYINLENRPERNGLTISELRKLGIKKPNRFNAITHEIPLVGCAMSHIGCIEKAKELNWDYVIIFEDDIKIESKKKCIEKFNKYIKTDFDVLYLGCWNFVKPQEVEKDLSKVSRAYCLHAYIVKAHYYDTLINHLKESIELKIKEPENMNYNNDVYIHTLQKKDNWYCITPIHITQRDGWSDNFKEIRNFSEKIKYIPH